MTRPMALRVMSRVVIWTMHARWQSRIRAGNIHINGASGGPDIPFGGYKQSGNGREWGAHGFTDYLEIKAIEGYTAA